ncbi:MAG: hypothetical protein HUU22_13630 [Phycisphaerae bacterium]|nr:hypothetical protein [Phycisphaerae bacterium]NUQ47061.1 hypothetical protein [Phycisphaerae bacterium]
MQTTAIDGSLAPGTTRVATTRGLNDMKTEDFFRLLITELQSQDPFKPRDSGQLVQEMSTIREMETSSALNRTLSSLAQQQRIGEAGGLIGRYVTGRVTSGSGGGESVPVEGVVIGVQFSSSGEAILVLHTGQQLPLRSVESITLVDPNSLEPQTPPATPPPGDPPPSDPPAGGTNQPPVATLRARHVPVGAPSLPPIEAWEA